MMIFQKGCVDFWICYEII